MIRKLRNARVGMLCLSFSLVTGCALNMPVPVKDPQPSTEKFATASKKPVSLYFVDQQEKPFKDNIVDGRIPMQPTYNDKPLDAANWLARNTLAELNARGLPVSLASSAEGASTIVQVKLINSTNHRVSGFSPFETYTRLKTDLVTGGQSTRAAFWIKRGKVPVWSFNEVIDPTFNLPLDIMSKDLAARIGKQLFNAAFSDAQVDALIARIEASKDVSDRDVFELGFSNNRRAIPKLVKLMNDGNQEVSHAAISSLGLLDATEQFPALKARYERSASDKEDRGIALKAICDLSSAEARSYAAAELARLQGNSDSDAKFFAAILALAQ